MTPPTGYTEDALVERPAISLLADLGWEAINTFHEFDHGASTLGRETRAEIILTAHLRVKPCNGSIRMGHPGSAEHAQAGKLVLDWPKHQQARAEVRVTIEKLLSVV